MYEDDDDRMDAADQLAELSPRAAAEALSAIACDRGVDDELRLSAAERLAAIAPGAAAPACLAIACDGTVGDEVRLSAAEQLAVVDPGAAAPACLAIARDGGVGDEVRLSAAEQVAAVDPGLPPRPAWLLPATGRWATRSAAPPPSSSRPSEPPSNSAQSSGKTPDQGQPTSSFLPGARATLEPDQNDRGVARHHDGAQAVLPAIAPGSRLMKTARKAAAGSVQDQLRDTQSLSHCSATGADRLADGYQRGGREKRHMPDVTCPLTVIRDVSRGDRAGTDQHRYRVRAAGGSRVGRTRTGDRGRRYDPDALLRCSWPARLGARAQAGTGRRR